MEFSVLKGCHDVINEEAESYSSIENILAQSATLYGFKEFRTPIIENRNLYVRSVGESSDIVRKEMYDFKDKGDRDITLRPEGTAGIIRSMVNAKLFAMNDFPIKAFYVGPNFRYERPQKGRYRQFNQFGVESVGVDSCYRDAEVISLGYNSLRLLGFKNLVLKINTLGDDESRQNYKKALVEYFNKHIDTMCGDCKERIKLNPLRILDCKVEHDIEIVKSAPKFADFLTEVSKERFNNLLEQLDNLEIEYVVDDTLVRGLDYYSGVVFEFHFKSNSGINYGAIGAGGHYDKLVNEIGGPKLEGVGFAFGIERLYATLKEENSLPELSNLDIYVIPLDKKLYANGLSMTNFLRTMGYSCEVNMEGSSVGTAIKKAVKKGSKICVIFGTNEFEKNTVLIKNLATTDQIEVKNDQLLESIDQIFGEEENGHEHHCSCCAEDEEHCHCDNK